MTNICSQAQDIIEELKTYTPRKRIRRYVKTCYVPFDHKQITVNELQFDNTYTSKTKRLYDIPPGSPKTSNFKTRSVRQIRKLLAIVDDLPRSDPHFNIYIQELQDCVRVYCYNYRLTQIHLYHQGIKKSKGVTATRRRKVVTSTTTIINGPIDWNTLDLTLEALKNDTND